MKILLVLVLMASAACGGAKGDQLSPSSTTTTTRPSTTTTTENIALVTFCAAWADAELATRAHAPNALDLMEEAGALAVDLFGGSYLGVAGRTIVEHVTWGERTAAEFESTGNTLAPLDPQEFSDAVITLAGACD